MAEQGFAADCQQPTLHYGFRQLLKPGVSAPSEAWRVWQGERPCGGRSTPPRIPSVAAVQEAADRRTTRLKRTQGTPETARESALPHA
jgi:hypothetical protein